MLKITLIAALATVVVVAAAFGIYNVVTAQTGVAQAATEPTAAPPLNGQGPQAASAQNTLKSGQPTAGQGANFAQGQGKGQAAGNGAAGGKGQQGQGWGQNQAAGIGAAGSHGQQQQADGQGAGIANPQNGIADWIEVSGTVGNVALPNFSLTTIGGEVIPVQLGNLTYTQQLGLNLVDGQEVTLSGGYEASGSLAVRLILVGEQVYELRDETGRPLWAGHGRQ